MQRENPSINRTEQSMVSERAQYHSPYALKIQQVSLRPHIHLHPVPFDVKPNRKRSYTATLYRVLASEMARSSDEGLQAEQNTDAQAQDAIVWASQHGLVNLADLFMPSSFLRQP